MTKNNKKEKNITIGPEVMLKNLQLENLINYQGYKNPGFQALDKIRSNIKDRTIRYELYKFMKEIMESSTIKAYLDIKDEIIKKFEKEQESKPPEKRLPKLPGNMPELIEHGNLDAMKINKFIIYNEDLGPDISEKDMALTDWLFEFKTKGKE